MHGTERTQRENGSYRRIGTIVFGAIGLFSPFLLALYPIEGLPVPMRAYGSQLGEIMSLPGLYTIRAVLSGGDGPWWLFPIMNGIVYAAAFFGVATIVRGIVRGR